VDASGKPISTSGIISLRKSRETHDEQTSANKEADGQFTIHFVSAGEYWVVFRVWGHGPVRESWLEPSAAYPQGTVAVKEGEHITGITLVAK